MILWTYWEGPRNPFIDACLASMERVCADGTEFRLVTPENADDYVGDWLHPNYKKIVSTRGCNPAAMRAGAIRAALLAKYGGMYWDADTIGLRNPAELVRQYEEMQFKNENRIDNPFDADVLYTTWDAPPRRALNGYIYMRRECEDAMRWLGAVNARLQSQPTNPVKWTELGERILTPILFRSTRAWRVPRKVFLPIDVDSDVEDFFIELDEYRPLSSWMSRSSVCFGMNYSYFVTRHRKEFELPPVQWGRSPLLIHQLLHWAVSL